MSVLQCQIRKQLWPPLPQSFPSNHAQFLLETRHAGYMELPCTPVFRMHVRAKLRRSCERKLHLPALHYTGRPTFSAAAFLSSAPACLQKTEAWGCYTPQRDSLDLDAAAATSRAAVCTSVFRGCFAAEPYLRTTALDQCFSVHGS